jgi:DNA-binding MarR family transcriptional regulator
MEDSILKIDNQLCFRLYAVSREMTKAYEPWLKNFNLTYPQYIVMLVLFEHKRIDFNDLSKIVQLKTGTLTPIVNKLNDIGYLTKEKNKDDGRKVFLELSNQGKQLNKDIIEVPLSMSSDLNISVDMYNILVKELDDLAVILKENNKNKGGIKNEKRNNF